MPENNTAKRKASATKSASPAKKTKIEASETDEVQICGDNVMEFYAKKRRSALPTSGGEFKFNKKRVRMISKVQELPSDCKGIVYWMFRDQRVEDNWALLWAQRMALKQEVPLFVTFCMPSTYLDATVRQYRFMIEGLKQVEKDLKKLKIPFNVLLGEAPSVLPQFIKEKNIGGVVADFLPLRKHTEWLNKVAKKLPENVAICQVDAHNIVPCWEASDKLEYAARTIRPKITNKLTTFLTEFPPVQEHAHAVPDPAIKLVDWKKVEAFIKVDRNVSEAKWAKAGTENGLKMLESFVRSRLRNFGTDRNNPTKNALSNLSPWFHTGQISTQRAALRVREFRGKFSDSVAGFLEEMIVRRELGDNFCFYNKHYDSLKGGYSWAQKTLNDHRSDKREKVYSREKLEEAKTHDPLWNAAQWQLVTEGKMHGFLRMYWAKKILEWTASPEEGLDISIYLNDKYSLDGIDPNGYVGCMWSIVGIHDQGWRERPVFGKIRYMNYDGCKRKFDVKAFERKYAPFVNSQA